MGLPNDTDFDTTTPAPTTETSTAAPSDAPAPISDPASGPEAPSPENPVPAEPAPISDPASGPEAPEPQEEPPSGVQMLIGEHTITLPFTQLNATLNERLDAMYAAASGAQQALAERVDNGIVDEETMRLACEFIVTRRLYSLVASSIPEDTKCGCCHDGPDSGCCHEGEAQPCVGDQP